MANIQQVSDGLRKQLIQEGSQVRPSAGDTITVECTGNIGDGTGQGKMVKKFWSTSDPGQKPFTFQVGIGQVIRGWDEGCMTMSQGERANLIIAGHKGYGEKGFPAWGIPPNAELIFQMHILSIEKKR